MVTIRKVDSSLMDVRSQREARALTPAQLRRREQDHQLQAAISKLRSAADVYEIGLEAGEKSIAIRQKLFRAASVAGIEIAIRKHGDGLLIGLLTPERRNTRSRRRVVAES